MARMPAADVASLDPYKFMAVIGKRVIRPGGRVSTEALLGKAATGGQSRMLDAGCGVATTAVEIARRFGAHVTAVDISPLMLEQARAEARASGLEDRVTVAAGDICALAYGEGSFDAVIAEAVTMFVDRKWAAAELARVCAPGGQVLATEFCWRQPPPAQAREIFLGQVCPGMSLGTAQEWVAIYAAAGLVSLTAQSGPFQMMTPRGFLADEGLSGGLAVMGRVAARPAYARKMAWLMPRMAKAVPYLGYVLIAGEKPARAEGEASP